MAWRPGGWLACLGRRSLLRGVWLHRGTAPAVQLVARRKGTAAAAAASAPPMAAARCSHPPCCHPAMLPTPPPALPPVPGTLVFPRNKYVVLRLGQKEVLCEDVLDSLVGAGCVL